MKERWWMNYDEPKKKPLLFLVFFGGGGVYNFPGFFGPATYLCLYLVVCRRVAGGGGAIILTTGPGDIMHVDGDERGGFAVR